MTVWQMSIVVYMSLSGLAAVSLSKADHFLAPYHNIFNFSLVNEYKNGSFLKLQWQ